MKTSEENCQHLSLHFPLIFHPPSNWLVWQWRGFWCSYATSQADNFPFTISLAHKLNITLCFHDPHFNCCYLWSIWVSVGLAVVRKAKITHYSPKVFIFSPATCKQSTFLLSYWYAKTNIPLAILLHSFAQTLSLATYSNLDTDSNIDLPCLQQNKAPIARIKTVDWCFVSWYSLCTLNAWHQ